jgi:hypothetical protein
MQSARSEDPATLAEVVPLAAVREARALAADCPGWRCWYSTQAALWYGRRIADRWVTERTGRTYVVIAGDATMLWAVITMQAVLDLAFEFAEWEIGCSSGGHWWATWRGPDDGQVHPIFCQLSPVKLAAVLREYVADMGERDDPRLIWLRDDDDE